MTSVKRKTPLWGYAANLFTVFWGNLVGSLIVAGLLGVSSGIFDAPATKACASEFLAGAISRPLLTAASPDVAAFATTKVVAPTFANILVRGIGCNIVST
jgi:formate/nitrite transporter FocA (FNT family)